MSDDKNIIDFSNHRKKNIESKKRAFERVFLGNFLGCYSVIDGKGAIYEVTLVDISEDGCQIQVPYNKNNGKQFKMNSEMTLRLYFTKDSYIPAIVTLKHGTEVTENGQTYMRYGCQFDKSVPTFTVLKSFIEFVYKFAEFSHIDKGDAKVYFL